MGDHEVSLERVLPPHASSAGQARALVRDALAQADAPEWLDIAQLAVSELVTNALVHAGTSIHVQIRFDDTGLRIEVADGSPHRPVRRDYSTTSGTGRGLRMLDDAVDRWGATPHGDGKIVWFELSAESDVASESRSFDRVRDEGTDSRRDAVDIELLNMPLLMHSAWQEHASALLREYLLVRLDEDVTAFERHAEASDAMNLLYEQIPAPELDPDPEALMAEATEPGVSTARMVLSVPTQSVGHFQTLDEMLELAVQMADAGELLVPPTQPEIRDMSAWLCAQVRDQSTGAAPPTPWLSRTDVRHPVSPTESIEQDRAEISASPRAVVATDEASVIIAVSRSAVELLGYDDESDLVGRRIIAIVPTRFHQAHIAGTTLHMTNGRSPLLGLRVTVPVVRADATEIMVQLIVDPRRLPLGRRIFVAEFFPETPGHVG